MHNYYCKNCNNIVGEWYINNDIIICCYYEVSQTNDLINFLECKKCDKFVGILCTNVCKDCFGKDIIIGEKKLFKWFQKYRKIKKFEYRTKFCEICNNNTFRRQCWYFKELTFHK